jgi:hypothetical protein
MKKPNTKIDGYMANSSKTSQEKIEKGIHRHSQIDPPLIRYTGPIVKSQIAKAFLASPMMTDRTMSHPACNARGKEWLPPSQHSQNEELEPAERVISENRDFADEIAPIIVRSQPHAHSPGIESPSDHSPSQGHPGSSRFREICKVIMRSVRGKVHEHSNSNKEVSFEELTAFSQAPVDDDRELFDIKYGTAIVGDSCQFMDNEKDPLLALLETKEKRA